MSENWWFLLGYFVIGLLLLEGGQWARRKWKLPALDWLACLMTFAGWPVIILLAFVLIKREKKND